MERIFIKSLSKEHERKVFPFLTCKGSPVSLGIGQGQAPEGVGRGKIILATLRYFSPPNLAQSGHGGNPASKKQEYWLQEPVSFNLKLKNMIGLKEEKGSGTNRTRVVNIREEDYDVYIGRAGRGMDGYFGNPFRLGAGMPRGATLEKYREYFYRRIHADPEFKRRVEGLQGKTLGCFCKPHPCHGDIIKEYLDSLSNK